MTGTLKEIFAESGRPSLATVADAVAIYAYNRKFREEDHQLVATLAEHGFKQASHIHPDDVIPGSTPQDKAAYLLIGQVMEQLVSNQSIDQDAIRNLKTYAKKQAGFQPGWLSPSGR